MCITKDTKMMMVVVVVVIMITIMMMIIIIIIIIIMTETEPISKTWVDMNHLTGLSAQDFNTFSPVASSKYYDSTGASLTKYATAFLT